MTSASVWAKKVPLRGGSRLRATARDGSAFRWPFNGPS
jgi:hypothetical protein